jgi:predicted 3-demethylubiquinone-9 3-methyltransferase (glyoxalase superfamily)
MQTGRRRMPGLQIVPTLLVELITDADPETSRRVMEAMLQMTKIEIAKLRQAYEG